MTDGQLLKEFVDGDQKAFAELVHRHAHWVWGCALRQVRENALAEDITQGAFILLARKAASLPAGVVNQGLEGWLFQVVHYLARDARKTSARRQFHEARVAAMQRDEAQAARDWDAIQTLLDDAVAKLREQDRHAVLLRFYQQMSLGEVAKVMQTSEASAAKRVSRAVDRLRGVLAQQGYDSAQQVHDLLETGMACAAPAALVAQIAAGGTAAGGAGSVMAAKAAKMLVAAKLKAAAVVVGATIVAGGIVGGAITAAHRPATTPVVSATTVPTVPAIAPEPTVQAPPIREGNKAVAVCLAVVTLPQNSLTELISSTQRVKLDPKLETRIGNAAQVRPILRDLLARYGDPTWRLLWNDRYRSGQFDEFQQDRAVSAAPAQGNQLLAQVRSSVQVSAGAISQIAGGYRIDSNLFGGIPSLNANIPFAPQTIRPGEVLVHMVRTQPDPRIDRAVLMIYEAVTVDESDFSPLTCLVPITDWFAKPINEHLRTARAGAIWQSQVTPATTESAAMTFAKTLPSGARIWIQSISDGSVHPILTWLPDGRPASLIAGASKPIASVRIVDPNLPPCNSPTKTYEAWPTVPLQREAGGGYAFRIGYGDGPYKVIGRMPMAKGANFKIGNSTLELEFRSDASYGTFRFAGDPGLDVDVCAVGKDGARVWNRRRYDTSYLEGNRPSSDPGFEFGMKLTDIEAIEVGTRPIVWIDFEGIAKRPTVSMPTGLEPAPEKLETRIAAAVPTDRKAFLDQVQCMRFWMSDAASKRDVWVWRDGRYRIETWVANTHTLLSGDAKTFAEYDFATAKWSASSTGRPHDADFQGVVGSIGGIEQMLKLGDVVGHEKVEGADCTIRKAKQESTEAQVWLDGLGLVHRIQFADAQMGGGIITYDPAGAEGVWYLPTVAGQKPFEQTAEEYLAKAVPIAKPLYEVTSAGRSMEVLSIARVQDDMVLLCTSTQLDAQAKKHRDETKEPWLATQLAPYGPADAAWTPRIVARIHMPYREVTWWVAQLPKSHPDPDLMELLVPLGRSGPGTEWWTMEKWIDSRPDATRLHLMQLDLASAEREDLETALRKIHTVVDGYRALGLGGQSDLITGCGSWEEFRAKAQKAITGTETLSESGR